MVFPFEVGPPTDLGVFTYDRDRFTLIQEGGGGEQHANQRAGEFDIFVADLHAQVGAIGLSTARRG